MMIDFDGNRYQVNLAGKSANGLLDLVEILSAEGGHIAYGSLEDGQLRFHGYHPAIFWNPGLYVILNNAVQNLRTPAVPMIMLEAPIDSDTESDCSDDCDCSGWGEPIR